MDALVTAAFDAVKLGIVKVAGIVQVSESESESIFPAGDAIEDDDEGMSGASESSGSLPSSVASSESGDADPNSSSSSSSKSGPVTSLVQELLLHKQAQEAATSLLSQFMVEEHDDYHPHTPNNEYEDSIVSRLGLKPIQLLLNVSRLHS